MGKEARELAVEADTARVTLFDGGDMVQYGNNVNRIAESLDLIDGASAVVGMVGGGGKGWQGMERESREVTESRR